MGAVAHVAHVDNMRWMLGLADALRAGEARLGPALLAAAPPDRRLQTPYRIVGDPLARLVGDRARSRARRPRVRARTGACRVIEDELRAIVAEVAEIDPAGRRHRGNASPTRASTR